MSGQIENINKLSFLERRIQEAGINLSQEQAESLVGKNSMIANMNMSIVQKCKGLTCPILNVCKLHAAKIQLPVGSLCPIESALLDEVISEYITGLNIDLTTPSGRLDAMQILELARYELIEFRTLASLANDSRVVRKEVSNIAIDGTILYEDRMAQELEILDKWQRMKYKIRTELLATRKSSLETGALVKEDAEAAARLIKKADNLKKMIEAKKSNIPVSDVVKTEILNE